MQKYIDRFNENDCDEIYDILDEIREKVNRILNEFNVVNAGDLNIRAIYDKLKDLKDLKEKLS